MLRIAVPNKGSLAEESIAILKEAGYRQRTDSRDFPNGFYKIAYLDGYESLKTVVAFYS